MLTYAAELALNYRDGLRGRKQEMVRSLKASRNPARTIVSCDKHSLAGLLP